MSDAASARIQSIEQLVRERTGISSARANAATREHLLRLAMARAGVADVAAYLVLLERDKRVFDDLISDLTVPESYFFREPAHYELLRSEVLPALVKARDVGARLSIWSAGCAGGEEAYSLAILFEQAGLAQRAHILGTDVSRRALDRALAGVYSRWALRATTPEEVTRYFDTKGTQFRVLSRYRKRVRFEQHSLATTPYPKPRGASGFDLILCRNVLIYFDATSIAAVGRQLVQSLTANGWLFLGPSDPRLEVAGECEVIATCHGALYRRRALHEASGAMAALRQAPEQRPPRPPAQQLLATAAPFPASEPAPWSDSRQRPPSRPPSPADSIEAVLKLAEEHGLRAAETGCRDELKLHPLSGALHLVHGKLLLELGHDAEAEVALRRALYLERGLLIAQMLSATLAERRGERSIAQRSYLQLAAECGARGAEEPVPFGDGLTCGTLHMLAMARASALDERGKG